MLSLAAPRVALGSQLPRLRVDDVLLRRLVVALIVAAIAEVTLLRLATRVGVHLPRGEIVGDGLQAASFFGSIAFNSASILAIALVALLFSLAALRLQDTIARLILGVLCAGLLLGLGLSLTSGSPVWDALFGLTATLLVALLGVALVSQKGVQAEVKLAVALILGAYLCYQYYSLSHIAYRMVDDTSLPPLGIEILRTGEVLVVGAGAAAFWAWGVKRWRRAGLAGVALVLAVVAAVALSSLTPSSTTSILALWTTGMSFFLPLPLYLVSLGLFLLTVVVCFRDRNGFWLSAGLILLLIAGYMPEATYHHLLIVLGVGFLAGAFHVVEEASARAPATTSINPQPAPRVGGSGN